MMFQSKQYRTRNKNRYWLCENDAMKFSDEKNTQVFLVKTTKKFLKKTLNGSYSPFRARNLHFYCPNLPARWLSFDFATEDSLLTELTSSFTTRRVAWTKPCQSDCKHWQPLASHNTPLINWTALNFMVPPYRPVVNILANSRWLITQKLLTINQIAAHHFSKSTRIACACDVTTKTTLSLSNRTRNEPSISLLPLSMCQIKLIIFLEKIKWKKKLRF